MTNTTEYFVIDAERVRAVGALVRLMVENVSRVTLVVPPEDFGACLAACGIKNFYSALTSDKWCYVWGHTAYPSERFGEVSVTVGTHELPAPWVKAPDAPKKAARHYQFNAVTK